MLRKLFSLVLTAIFLLAVGSSTVAHNGRIYIPNEIEPTGDEHPWGGENNLGGVPSLNKTDDGSSESDLFIDSGILTRLFGSVSFYGIPIRVHITLFSIDESTGHDKGDGNDSTTPPPPPPPQPPTTDGSSGSGDK